MIRALLVDDHQIVRSGVRRVLEATGRFDIVGEAAGVGEALERARLLRPDVVVLDLTLRDGSGLDAIADLRELGARVVILSMQDEPAYARKAFELGAQGYVVKDAADEELADAIDAVLADRIYVHPALAARLVHGRARGRPHRARAPDPPPDRARATRTRRSPDSSSSASARSRPTAGTSWTSSGSRRGRSSSATRSSAASSRSARPDRGAGRQPTRATAAAPRQ